MKSMALCPTWVAGGGSSRGRSLSVMPVTIEGFGGPALALRSHRARRPIRMTPVLRSVVPCVVPPAQRWMTGLQPDSAAGRWNICLAPAVRAFMARVMLELLKQRADKRLTDSSSYP